MTKKQFNKIIDARIEAEEREHNSALKALEVLKPWEGKQVNKRTFKNLPEGYKLVYDRFNHPQVETPEGINLNLLPNLKSNRAEDHEHSEHNLTFQNSCYFNGSKERLQKLKALDREKAYQATKSLLKALQTIKEITEGEELNGFSNPASYYIKEELFKGLEMEHNWRLKDITKII